MGVRGKRRATKPRERDPVPVVQVDGAGNLAPTEIRSPDCPGRSQSLALQIELILPQTKTVYRRNITLFLVRVIF
jgi:hypothetical protein